MLSAPLLLLYLPGGELCREITSLQDHILPSPGGIAECRAGCLLQDGSQCWERSRVPGEDFLGFFFPLQGNAGDLKPLGHQELCSVIHVTANEDHSIHKDFKSRV